MPDEPDYSIDAPANAPMKATTQASIDAINAGIAAYNAQQEGTDDH